MAKVKGNTPVKGEKVKVIGGEHAGVVGKLVHIRQHTQQAHVQPDSGTAVVVVSVKEIAAA